MPGSCATGTCWRRPRSPTTRAPAGAGSSAATAIDGALVLRPCRQVHTVRDALPDRRRVLRRATVVVLRTVHAARRAGCRPVVRRAAFVIEAEAGAFERWRLRRATASSSADDATPTERDRSQLVLVATPIGNLGDLSPRAVEALRDADVIAAEDTRRTRALLTHAGMPGGGRLRAVHAHNERAERATGSSTRCATGKRVAYVTDAGMPGISDPGERLVRACLDAGLAVEVVPGPSAVLTALVLSGFPTDRFVFEGFLPRRGPSARERLAAIVRRARAPPCSSRRRPRARDARRPAGRVRTVARGRRRPRAHQAVRGGVARRRSPRRSATSVPTSRAAST